ncbi:MAG: XdhC family protein [Burkholderiales bacterium]|nr:XdhC family protein [Burkholderiales bacterium]
MNNAETVFEAARRLQQVGTPYALVSVIKALAPASARPGDKAIVTADGDFHGWVGGGCAQPAVVRTVRQALADGRARLIRIAPTADGHERDLGDVLEFGMACHSGGTLELFIDPVLPRAQLVVIGASSVAASLTQLAPRVGFAVTLIAHEADAAHYPDAQRVIASDDAVSVAAQVAPGAWVVVATQGRRDVQALRLALALNARQVSFVASARKAQVLKASLVAAGADAGAVAAIVAPAGYPMAATTPEEIALSVLAAVVSQRRGPSAAVSSPCGMAESLTEPLTEPTPVAAGVTTAATPSTASGSGASIEALAATAVSAIVPSPSAASAAPLANCCGGAVVEAPSQPAAKPSCCGG